MENAGARIIDREGLICHGTPDTEGEAECEALGKRLPRRPEVKPYETARFS